MAAEPSRIRKPGRRAGTQKTGGRKAGTPNKVTADIREVAQGHGPAALSKLVFWMNSDNPKASVAACNAILDRAYGKPPQALTVDPGASLLTALDDLVRRIDGTTRGPSTTRGMPT